jgi:hypothetical protein
MVAGWVSSAQLWLIAGQGFEQCDDIGIFLVAELLARLQWSHNGNRIAQCGSFATVKIRIGEFDIAQFRHFKLEPVGIFAGDSSNAFGGICRFIRLDNAHFLKTGTAQSRAVMAGDTAAVFKQGIAGKLLLGDGVFIT